MKVLIRQFLGKNHSWSTTGWGLAHGIKKNHELHLYSTDGIEHLPPDLKENLIGYNEENEQTVFGRMPDSSYDCQISYTCMKNFPHLLSHGTKNRLGIWVWEWKNGFPIGFAKHHQSCDFVCAPSQFGKQNFVDAGVPQDKVVIIPHGIKSEQFRQTTTISLPTKKRFKLLAVVAQNHIRKNIPGLLDAYGKAFTNKDDVCLIIKSKLKLPKHQFDISLNDCLNNFYRKYPQHAELKLFNEFIEDMSSLYRSVDATFSMANCEGFYYPGLESMAAGKLSIAPNWGGQVDFLNENNALLISGKEGRAESKSMYWESRPNATWFVPSIDDAVDKLRYALEHYEKINAKVDEQRVGVYDTYDWEAITSQFLKLCRP